MGGSGKGGGRSKAPYEDELAGMFAGQNMINMAARNPNAAAMFRPGSALGNSYKDMFGTSNLPAQQTFQLPSLGIAAEANQRVFGGRHPGFELPQQQDNRQFGFQQPVAQNNAISTPVQQVMPQQMGPPGMKLQPVRTPARRFNQ